jgi:2-isopropylmalate synthase
VANSLAAVRAGVRQIQGTLNGIGERCGNANLVTLIPTLMLKAGLMPSRFEIGVTPEQLAKLTGLSRASMKCSTARPTAMLPMSAPAAFATKAGIHASALLKEPETYEHMCRPKRSATARCWCPIRPASPTSQCRRSALGSMSTQRPALDMSCWPIVKEREAAGYAYEGADASLALLAHRRSARCPLFQGGPASR